MTHQQEIVRQMKIPVIIMCVTLCGLITHSKGLDSLGPVAHYLERDYGASKMKEVWISIFGYEGLYEVSNIGRVKSLHRKYSPGNRILKFNLHPKGYYAVALCKNNTMKTYRTHALVALAFLGPRPKGLGIDHINNQKTDNRADNLEYVTQRENISRGKGGLLKENRSSKHMGVSWHKYNKVWDSRININGKKLRLGYFKKEVDAAKAYQDKLLELGGDL